MKKYLSILALAALTACSNEEDFSRNPNEIRLTSAIGVMTRAASNLQNEQIEYGQKVGVTIRGAASEHNNVEWTADGSGVLSTDNTINWGDGGISVYAYHPRHQDLYSGGFDNDDFRFTFEVQEDQSTDENYLNSDLLWATATVDEQTPVAIPLDFTHKLSKINVVLQDGSLGNATISLCDVFTGIAFEPITGKFVRNEYGDIIYGGHGDIIAGTGTKKASAIIVPQTIEGYRKFIKIEVGNDIYYYTPTSEKTFEGGKEYTFNLTIRASVAVDLSQNVQAWDSKTDNEDHVTDGGIDKAETHVQPGAVEDGHLTHTGELNEEDINILRRMIDEGHITSLDLSGAEIMGDNNILNFSSCSNLVHIELPTSLEKLPAYSFSNIESLESVIIHVDNLTEVGFDVFLGSPNLTAVTLNGSSDMLTQGASGELYRKNGDERWAMWCPSNATAVTLPDDLWGIDTQVFRNTKLTTITFPSGIKEIGHYSFAGVALKSVTCLSETPIELDGSWAGNRYSEDESYKIAPDAILYVPNEECVQTYSDSKWKSFFENIEVIKEE